MADDQRTGGMIALIPDNADELAVAGGHDPDELHLTLLYLGDDVASWDEEQRERLREMLTASAPALDPVVGRAMGHAVFNPDAYEDRDPTVVYLIGDAPGLAAIRDWALWATTTGAEYATPPEQFDPYLPHISALESDDPGLLSYVGPITFNTLRLALGEDSEDIPLGRASGPPEAKARMWTPPQDVCRMAARLRGSTAHLVAEGKALTGHEVAWVARYCGEPGARWAGGLARRMETKRMVSTAERDRLRDRGQTLHSDSRSYPIKTLSDLDNAITAWGRCKPTDRAALKRLLRSMARQLGASSAVRERIENLGASSKVLNEDDIEVKVASPDPRAVQLRNYWAHGEGVGKWLWPGATGNFRRLRRRLSKYVKSPHVLNGLTANIYRSATGQWPGKKRGNKSFDWSGVETKSSIAAVDEETLFDGVDEWGEGFADEDLTGIPLDETDDGEHDEDDGIKAADPDLLRLSRSALIGQRLITDEDGPDELSSEESWEEIVAADDRWMMDPDGVMHREQPTSGLALGSAPSLFELDSVP